VSGSEDGDRRVKAAVPDPYLEACIQAAQAGGRAARNGVDDRPTTKNDLHMGHHAVVSGAD
jgi:hypothetical protein